MKSLIFLIVVLLTNPIFCQIPIIELTENEAMDVLSNLKRDNIGHTHIKQWTDDFVNIDVCRNEYILALTSIRKNIKPDHINFNRNHEADAQSAPYVWNFKLEYSEESLYNFKSEIGDTIYVYASGLPLFSEDEKSTKTNTVSDPNSSDPYDMISHTIYIGIICNSKTYSILLNNSY
jgi:hypothetical protein